MTSFDVAISKIAATKPVGTLADDVREGLTGPVKRLSPKYFYDELGAQLFEQICATPEYYLSRTEFTLLERHAANIIERTQPNNVIEFGSGASRKTRALLDAWESQAGPRTYWPFDVSEEMLREVAEQLDEDYLTLAVHGLIGDYTAGLQQLPTAKGSTLALFLGSTLGNFAHGEARSFVAELSAFLHSGDHFLLGVDLHKDNEVLESAYNDKAGITAQFNKNMLTVLNRELGANFDLDQFRHLAIYNREQRQIEMYLESIIEQHVRIEQLDLTIQFAAGESIWTEVSRKFKPDDIEMIFDAADLDVVIRYMDAHFPYALALGRKR